MRGRSSDAAGFSLVEVIIAMFLLGIIAVAILPALWQGLMISSQQSSTATATRYMNSLVEQARDAHSCPYLGSIKGFAPITDGRGVELSASNSSVSGCAPGSMATLTVVVEGEGKVLATTTALIFIP